MASATFCVQAANLRSRSTTENPGNRTRVAVLRQSSSVKNVQVLNVRVVLQKQSDDGDNHSWAASDTGSGRGKPRETPLVRAVRESRKSVVNTHRKVGFRRQGRSFLHRSPRKVTGMGTGIVVDERGYIVTNYHVIQDVDLISVTIHGGSTYEGHPVSYDRKHDLAIIRIAAKDHIAVMPMGNLLRPDAG